MNNKYSIYIDEAWRWPLAWPVFVWLVVPLSFFDIEEFHDSKIVSPKNRNILYTRIKELENENRLIYSFWYASNKEIDKYGISKSINLSICRWLFQLLKKLFIVIQSTIELDLQDWKLLVSLLNIQSLLNEKNINEITLKNIISEFDNIIQLKWIFIDGNRDFDLWKSIWKKITTIIDWDAKNKYISMASIVAKQERDRLMENLPNDYIQYNFGKHKWYWTAAHMNSIVEFWASDLHRISYLKKLMVRENVNVDNYWSLDEISSIPIICEQDKTHKWKKPSILLHICCAPDLTFPLKLLKKYFKVYLVWYNPNIQDEKEHNLRFAQLEKLLSCDWWNYSLLEASELRKDFNNLLYENRDIIDEFKELWEKNFIWKISKIPEYWKRCDICYYFRLLVLWKIADSMWIDYFTTTLSISPKKDILKIQKYWILVSEKCTKSKFVFFDFRKNWWYIQSLELTKKYWLYRQNYCGCNYSKKL